MRVLGIETSCDDTGVAVYDSVAGLLANRLATQVDLHRQYGGVVPELAARDHLRTLLPLIDHVLGEAAGCHHGNPKPDAVAYTAGPGLAGALLVGAAVGKSLAHAWGVPSIGVHHMEGHLLAPMLESTPPSVLQAASPSAFPLLALLVSGGHTMLVDVAGVGAYHVLGQTLDDAAGEAFDKTAKLLRLGYPGGPAIAQAALNGQPGRFSLPRPMTNRAGLDFSFSGLKTQVRTTVGQIRGAQAQLARQSVADIALAFETAVVETLVIKCLRGLRQTGRRRLAVSGGVGANTRLRERLRQAAGEVGVEVFYPRPALCTDNGAMIAYAGCLRLTMARAGGGQADHSGQFDVRPRWRLDEI